MSTIPFKVIARDGVPFAVQLGGAELLAPIVATATAAAGVATAKAEEATATVAAGQVAIGAARDGAVAAIGMAKVGAISDVTAALGLITDVEGVAISRAAGVTVGFYIADESIPVGLAVKRFYARVTGGTGSVAVSIIRNGTQEVYGSVVVGPTKVEATGAPLFTLPAKSDLSVLIESLTGTVTRLIVKIEGIPA